MSCYPVCPTCGRLLADKKLILKERRFAIDSMNLNEEERKKEYDKLWKDLKIPLDNLCCRMRLLCYNPLEDIIK